MKAFPLIYSRTKNYDFVPDFLARPKDLDCETALKYVKNAMSDLDFISGIRYTVFSVGNYCVCGGISCISSRLFDTLKRSTVGSDTDLHGAEAYLRDCKGRSVACFIGIAIPINGIQGNVVPDVTLEKYWKIYLEYLKHQWESTTETTSEQLEFPPLEIDEKEYRQGYIPDLKPIGSRYVVTDFKDHSQEILDYFFSQVLNGKNMSFITEINNRTEWERLSFNTASVPASLFKALQDNPTVTSQTKQTKVGQTAAPTSGFKKLSLDDTEETQKKTPKNELPMGILLVAAVCIVIVLLLIFKKGH